MKCICGFDSEEEQSKPEYKRLNFEIVEVAITKGSHYDSDGIPYTHRDTLDLSICPKCRLVYCAYLGGFYGFRSR